MAEHVNKELTTYGYSEFRGPGEIRLERLSCTVLLGKEHRPLRHIRRPPLLEPALENGGAQDGTDPDTFP